MINRAEKRGGRENIGGITTWWSKGTRQIVGKKTDKNPFFLFWIVRRNGTEQKTERNEEEERTHQSLSNFLRLYIAPIFSVRIMKEKK